MTRRLAAAAAALALGLPLVTGCSEDHGSPEAVCSILGDGRSYTALFEQGFDPTDTQRAITQLQAARTDLEQLRGAAPKDLHDPLDAEATYLDALLRVIDTVDADDPAAVVAGINALETERSAAQVASLELRSFEEAHCHEGGTASVP